MIWFWVPASLVICNDIFAYIWGVTTGRTPLLALSPKKTVEGFVGAIFSTLIFGFFVSNVGHSHVQANNPQWGTFFMRFNYMICPVENLGVTAWSDIHCKPNTVFVWRVWRVPFTLILPFVSPWCIRPQPFLTSGRSGKSTLSHGRHINSTC
jgi:phosphatidate cytidylyltransferase